MIRLFGLVLFLVSSGVQAIVNIESMKFGPKKLGFYSQLGFNAAGASGNTDKLSLSVNSRLNWQAQARTNFIVAEFEYGETQGQKDSEKAFVHARHIGQLSQKRDWEAFVQGSKNEFARLNFRGLLGSGLRLALGPKSNLYVGLGAFYERESIQQEAGTLDASTNDTWRMNTYLVYKDQINDYVKFSNVLYLQPALDEFSDLRVLGQFALLVKAGKAASIKLSINLAHDEDPPQNVDQTDVQYSTGIIFEF